jgi:hypothetical protein
VRIGGRDGTGDMPGGRGRASGMRGWWQWSCWRGRRCIAGAGTRPGRGWVRLVPRVAGALFPQPLIHHRRRPLPRVGADVGGERRRVRRAHVTQRATTARSREPKIN